MSLAYMNYTAINHIFCFEPSAELEPQGLHPHSDSAETNQGNLCTCSQDEEDTDQESD